jgi:hypothetical protein
MRTDAESRLGPADYAEAAAKLGCEPAVIQAVAEVEAANHAFLSSGSPTCLFERHLFHRLTGGRFDTQAPDLSNVKPGGYGSYSDQPVRVAAAVLLDREAALRATSWGMFQILGENWHACGAESLEQFVSSMYRSAQDHLRAFVGFVNSNPWLSYALRLKDWASFARHYNGPSYAAHDYDGRLARCYAAIKEEADHV